MCLIEAIHFIESVSGCCYIQSQYSAVLSEKKKRIKRSDKS